MKFDKETQQVYDLMKSKNFLRDAVIVNSLKILRYLAMILRIPFAIMGLITFIFLTVLSSGEYVYDKVETWIDKKIEKY